MNLELINEIIELKARNRSYTEIAEVIGIGRTAIVLVIRLYTVLQNHYSSNILSLQENINLLNSQIDVLKNQCTHKDSDINRLTKLVNIDENTSMVISKNDYYSLANDLKDLGHEVDILNTKLAYLNNMSFGEKLKWLFITKDKK